MDEEFADFDADKPLPFELYRKFDSAEDAKKGGVKSYTATGDSGVFFESRKSDYYTTVERVLGVDGWQSTSENGKTHTQRMTLLILKIVVSCTADGGRVRSIKSTLQLENQKTGGKAEPVLEAWAPFRHLTLTNPTKAKMGRRQTTAVAAGGAAYGAKAQMDVSVTNEIAFQRTYFDRAFATVVMSQSRRAGVYWYMEQNDLENRGVPPETFVAVLFKRDTDDPYIVKFDIDVRGGTLHDLRKNAEKAFGMRPGHTKPFRVQPSTKIKIRGEGHDYLPAVEKLVNSLGKLRAKDSVTGLTILRGSVEDQTAGKEEIQKEENDDDIDGGVEGIEDDDDDDSGGNTEADGRGGLEDSDAAE